MDGRGVGNGEVVGMVRHWNPLNRLIPALARSAGVVFAGLCRSAGRPALRCGRNIHAVDTRDGMRGCHPLSTWRNSVQRASRAPDSMPIRTGESGSCRQPSPLKHRENAIALSPWRLAAMPYAITPDRLGNHVEVNRVAVRMARITELDSLFWGMRPRTREFNMGFNKLGMALFAAALAFSSSAMAQDDTQREGVILSQNGSNLSLRTREGPLNVVLSPTTEIRETAGIA